MVAISGFWELGNEVEHYSGHYHYESNTMPYLLYGFNPVEGSPLVIEGLLSYNRRYGNSQRGNDFARYDLYCGYTFYNGNLILKPMAGFRQEEYRNHKKSLEYRFFPQFDYLLAKHSKLRLLGFVAPMNVKDRNREPAPDSIDSFDRYGDYRHELQFSLDHNLESLDSIRVAFYSEVIKVNDVSGSSEKLRNEGQLRFVYTKRFSNCEFKPWIRAGLYRIKKNAKNQQKDEVRHRVGFDLIYKFAPQTEFVSRLYFQQEDKQTWEGKYVDHKNRTFVRLAVRRYF